MPKGKATLADIAEVQTAPKGMATLDDIAPDEAPKEQRPGFLSRAWNAINTPVVDFAGGKGATANALLGALTGGMVNVDDLHEAASAPPTISDSNHPILSGLKKGIAGAVADSADTLAGFSSPAGLVSLGLGGATRIPGAVGKIAKVGLGASSGLFAGAGAESLFDRDPSLSAPDSLQRKLFGAAQVAGGAAGVPESMRGAAPGISSRLVNSILRPGLKEFDFGRNPGQSVVDAGITANSKAGLLSKIIEARKGVGQQIGDALRTPQAMAKSIDARPTIQPVNDAMADAARTGEQALASRLFDVRQGLTKNMDFAAYDPATRQPISPNLVEMGDKNLSNVSPADLFGMKRDVGAATKWHGAPFDADVNQARAGVYGKMRDAINSTVPEVAPLNEQYGGLLGAEKSLDKTLRVGERHANLNLADISTGGLGALTGLTGSAPEALGSAALAMLARRLFGSTAVKTRAAQLFAKPSPVSPLSPVRAIPAAAASANHR
jgi:hypothetical protein